MFSVNNENTIKSNNGTQNTIALDNSLNSTSRFSLRSFFTHTYSNRGDDWMNVMFVIL